MSFSTIFNIYHLSNKNVQREVIPYLRKRFKLVEILDGTEEL